MSGGEAVRERSPSAGAVDVRGGFSLRYKVLTLVGVVLLGAMLTYLGLAIKLISEDKLENTYDLNATLVSTLGEEVASSTSSLADKLTYFLAEHAREPGGRSQGRLPEDAGAAMRLFASDRDLLAVEIWRREATGYQRVQRWSEEKRLAGFDLLSEDLRAARAASPVRWQAALSQGLLIQNASIAPDIALSLLVVPGAEGSLMAVAEFRPDRFLRLFGRRELVTAYLVDERGVVVAHPDADKVVAKADLSARPVVHNAIEQDTALGARAFTDAQGTEIIGAFAHLPTSRLAVITEVAKVRALAAGRELIERSVVFAVGILALALLISIFFSRRLSTPLRRLAVAATRVQHGDYDVSVPVTTRDEVGVATQSFNKMAQALLKHRVELQQAYQQLMRSEKLATAGELAAALTHEAKNPMVGMRGFAQLGLRTQSMEEAHEFFGLIEKETRRAETILNGFLRFTRTEVTMSALAINDVVRNTLPLVTHQLRTKRIRLETELAEDLPTITGSGDQLQQVLLNLLINAQHAIESQGQGTILLRTAPDDGGVVFEVRDDGCGMTEETKANLFKAFYTTKEAGQGTGLGMAISQRIVAAHQGRIGLESTMGAGTRFTVHLPARDVAAAAELSPPEPL